MAFDVGIGDLIGSLFFPSLADLGATAADVAPEAIDVGLGAADSLGGAGAIAAGAGDLAAGTAADIGAAAAPATELLGDTGAAAGDTAATIPAGVDLAASQDLGTSVGDALEGANFAPTTADTAAATGGLNAGSAAPGTTAAATSGATTTNLGSGLTSATQEAATGPQNLNAALGITDTTAPPADVTSIQTAAANSPEANIADVANPPAAPPSGTGSEIAASAQTPSGQLAAEGGLSPDTQVALAQAGGASAAAPPGLGESVGNALSNAGSSLGSTMSSPLFKLGELGIPAGMLAYNLIKGPQPIPPQATQAVQNAETQLGSLQGQASQNVPLFNQTAATDLNLANNFKISPAQAASISQWQQNQYNQLYQQIANQGNTNPMASSEWVQGKNQIDQQALAQQVQMINQLISTAFQAASAANAGVSTSANVTAQFDATLMQAANLQVQQDQNFQNAVGSAMQAFGLIAGLSAGGLGKNAANTNTPTAAAA